MELNPSHEGNMRKLMTQGGLSETTIAYVMLDHKEALKAYGRLGNKSLDKAIGDTNRIALDGLLDIVKEVALFCIDVQEKLESLDVALKKADEA
jgi:hypothetical protein